MWYWKFASLSCSPLCYAIHSPFPFFQTSEVEVFSSGFVCSILSGSSVITVTLICKNVETKICFQNCTYGLCIRVTLVTCFLFSLLFPWRISCWVSLHAIIYYCFLLLTTSSVSVVQRSVPNVEMRQCLGTKEQSLPVPRILAFPGFPFNFTIYSLSLSNNPFVPVPHNNIWKPKYLTFWVFVATFLWVCQHCEPLKPDPEPPEVSRRVPVVSGTFWMVSWEQSVPHPFCYPVCRSLLCSTGCILNYIVYFLCHQCII